MRTRRAARCLQPGLGLRVMPSERDLRAVHEDARIRVPFEQAIASPALAICLRNAAEERLAPRFPRAGRGRRR